MKPSILTFLIFVLCFCTEVFAQKEWRIKASFGASDAALLDKGNFLGGPTYEVSSFYDLGLRARRKWILNGELKRVGLIVLHKF